MKKFLIKSLIFSLIVLVSLVAGEILIKKIDNPYSIKDRAIREKGKDIQTVFLGNSHTFYGLRADLWHDKAINLSNVSQTLAYDRHILEHYIDSMPNLKNVVMQVSFTSLYDDDLENTSSWWLCSNYHIYMHLGLHPKWSKYSLEILNLQVYSKKVLSLLHLAPQQLRADFLGDGLGYDRTLPDAELESSGVAAALGHKESSDLKRIPQNLEHLKAISKVCKDKGINLWFYTQPESEYYKIHTDTLYLNTMMRTIEQFAKENNAHYFNLYNDSRFKKNDFFDADHLNHDQGAVKLTKILADTIASYK